MAGTDGAADALDAYERDVHRATSDPIREPQEPANLQKMQMAKTAEILAVHGDVGSSLDIPQSIIDFRKRA